MNDLSRRLADLVRGVPGVVTLYDASPLPSRILEAAAGIGGLALGSTADVAKSADNIVSVIEGDDLTAISVSIGVSDTASASAVCRAVHDLIAEQFGGPSPDRTISVRISSIG
ncbi:MAG: hypothetical protein H7146_12810 [Burkholderiaceae bacterium]|nr:hypothetical protein [Microbacteriaceae bacterium]